MTNFDAKVALVLSGGNALGSYQAGVYEALHAGGLSPEWIVGSSIGAINGAIIAGNPPADRIEKLSRFWRAGTAGSIFDLPYADTIRRTAAVNATLLTGRPGLFAPIGSLGPWGSAHHNGDTPSFLDSAQLESTLETLVDFDLLNAGPVRFCACAVDIETGEEVVFDTSRERVNARHVRASASLIPMFASVGIAGRSYVDGGFSANLPLDPVLAEPGAERLLCIAADLLPKQARPPATLGESISRAQDLMFACQSRRTIARWRSQYTHDAVLGAHHVALARLAYTDQEAEVAGKAMDFSPASARQRWDAGIADAAKLLQALPTASTSEPGLTILNGFD
ncbi:patatin-like phospholipase family protein [Blastomonas aquatica]|uniref:Membrane protein n=1 Tax=Blastomonas aquatica TaxID=1510276 RepID=A0ABQ1J1Y5_9SPHN|nr:patatin-like phospholipase family protein [Blastomonas aquatica]GGB56848.1 membrane protein [Blastomonas aquatica]